MYLVKNFGKILNLLVVILIKIVYMGEILIVNVIKIVVVILFILLEVFFIDCKKLL